MFNYVGRAFVAKVSLSKVLVEEQMRPEVSLMLEVDCAASVVDEVMSTHEDDDGLDNWLWDDEGMPRLTCVLPMKNAVVPNCRAVINYITPEGESARQGTENEYLTLDGVDLHKFFFMPLPSHRVRLSFYCSGVATQKDLGKCAEILKTDVHVNLFERQQDLLKD